MQAVLLAAGQATRLRPLTDDRPKCLLEVGGETILTRAVRILADSGCDRFTVVDGYRGDMIRSALGARFPRLEVRYVRNHDFAVTNNAWSLLGLQQALQGQEKMPEAEHLAPQVQQAWARADVMPVASCYCHPEARDR